MAGAQRIEGDLGAGEVVAALDACTGVRLQHLRHQLGQHRALGEILGADDDGGRIRGSNGRRAGHRRNYAQAKQ